MKKEILGKCMLLMSALIWGSSFIVMKNAVDFISPFTLLCIRFVLSTIFISILFFILPLILLFFYKSITGRVKKALERSTVL